jgi:hypothetical protein
VSGGLYCLGRGGWRWACSAGIQESMRLRVWLIESAR